MITKITTLKELPYKTYTAWLLKSEEDIKEHEDGYLYISKSPKMIMLFVEYIDEIYGKMNKNQENIVKLSIETN